MRPSASSVTAAWGEGGALPDFIFCSLFPVQQTTSWIGQRLMLSLEPRPFVQPSLDLRYKCVPTSLRSYLTTDCVLFLLLFFLFLFLLFGDVAFPEYLLPFSLYGEYIVRFSLPESIFLPCDHGLDFDISYVRVQPTKVCFYLVTTDWILTSVYVRIQSTNQSIQSINSINPINQSIQSNSKHV